MDGVEILVALTAVLAGLASAARGHAPSVRPWRLKLAVGIDTANLAVTAFLTGWRPEVIFGTPILLVAMVSLGDWALAMLQLRGAAGRAPPGWLI